MTRFSTGLFFCTLPPNLTRMNPFAALMPFRINQLKEKETRLVLALYCVSEILTCRPPRVLVMGNALLIFGMLLFCSK